MQILNVLAPVFLLIAIGAVLQRSEFVSRSFLTEANRITYWLGLPALLFVQLVDSFNRFGGAGVMLTAMLLATAGALTAGYLAAWILRVPGPATGTFVQGAFRGNLAYVGLPIIFSLPDDPLAWGLSVRTAAILIVAPAMIAYSIAATCVLLASQHAAGWAMVKPLGKQLVTTPLFLATLAGTGFALTGWTLPVALDKTFHALGAMALPLGLLGVGGSLTTTKLAGHWRAPLTAALLKTALSPLLGWLVGRACGLGPGEMKVLLVLLACPTAAGSYTMAVEMKGDGPLASGIIVLSVLASVVPLAFVIGMPL